MDASSLYQALTQLLSPAQQTQPMYRALQGTDQQEKQLQDVRNSPTVPQQVTTYGNGQ